MKNQKQIEDWDDYPLELKPAPGSCCPDYTKHIVCIGCDTDYGSYAEALADEKDKWKAEMMDGLDGLKVVEPPDVVEELSDKRQAFIAGQMNLLMRIQQLREKIEKL